MQTINIGNSYEASSAPFEVTPHSFTRALTMRNSGGYAILSTSSSHIDAELMAATVIASRDDAVKAAREISDVLLDPTVMHGIIMNIIPNQAMIKPNTALLVAESGRMVIDRALAGSLSAGGRQFITELLVVAAVSGRLMAAPATQYYPVFRPRVVPTFEDILAESTLQELTTVFGTITAKVDFGGMSQISATELATQLSRQLQDIGVQLRYIGHRERHVRTAFALLRMILEEGSTTTPEINNLGRTAAAQELLSNFTVVQAVLEASIMQVEAPISEYEEALRTLTDVLSNSRRMQITTLDSFAGYVGHTQVFGPKRRLLGAVIYRNLQMPQKAQVLSVIPRAPAVDLWQLSPLTDAAAAIDTHVVKPLAAFSLAKTAAATASILAQLGDDGFAQPGVSLIGFEDLTDSDTRQLILHYAASRASSIVMFRNAEGFVELGFKQIIRELHYSTASAVDSGLLLTLDPYEIIAVSESIDSVAPAIVSGQFLPIEKSQQFYVIGSFIRSKMFHDKLSGMQQLTVDLPDQRVAMPPFKVAHILRLIDRADMMMMQTPVANRIIRAHLDACTSLLNRMVEGGNQQNQGLVYEILRREVAIMLNDLLAPLYTRSSTKSIVDHARATVLRALVPSERAAMATSLEHAVATTQLRLNVALMLMRAVDYLRDQDVTTINQVAAQSHFALVASSLRLDDDHA